MLVSINLSLEKNCKKPVVVVIRLLPRDGGMAEDHGAPESGQLFRAWTRDRREKKLPKSEQRKEPLWTVQNEMKDVQGWITAGTA